MLVSTGTIHALVIFLCAGAIAGLIYDSLFIFKVITKQNILVVNILDFLFCLVGGLLLIYCIFRFEWGNFALFEVICFVCGVVFEQIIVKNLFTIPFKWVYNKFNLIKVKKSFNEINNKRNR